MSAIRQIITAIQNITLNRAREIKRADPAADDSGHLAREQVDKMTNSELLDAIETELLKEAAGR